MSLKSDAVGSPQDPVLVLPSTGMFAGLPVSPVPPTPAFTLQGLHVWGACHLLPLGSIRVNVPRD